MKQIGVTPEGQPVVDGVFFFVGTKGLPLEEILYFFKDKNIIICWPSYFRDAMGDGAKYRTVRSRVTTAISDVYGADYLQGFEETLDRWHNSRKS